MQVKKTEIIEVEKAETKFGTFHEWKNGLAVSFKTPSELSITLFKDELRIRIPVIRSGHDHNDEATITIKGLKFITNERERYPPLKQGQEIIPTIIFYQGENFD